jgi:hypothetical protein
MKKILAKKQGRRKRKELASEYRFDYSKLKLNRFAARMPADTIAVVLEPDVAAVFKSSERVNAVLRSVISSGPQSKRKN